MSKKKPLVLTIMDGWGCNPSPANNAVAMARTPNFDRLWASNPHTLIRTDGPFVGLPEGQMGNSEVGHLSIGSGRIIHMDITRIDEMIASGSIFTNSALKAAMAHGRSHSLHLLGLVSDGGVHSQMTHLFALLEMAKREGVERVYVHCFTDGRDKPPHSGVEFIEQLPDLSVGVAHAGVVAMDQVASSLFRNRPFRWNASIGPHLSRAMD